MLRSIRAANARPQNFKSPFKFSWTCDPQSSLPTSVTETATIVLTRWVRFSRLDCFVKMPTKPVERTKVVVRKLPPLMSEAELRDEVDSVAADQYDWLSFVPGKVRCVDRLHIKLKRNGFTRALSTLSDTA